MTRHVVTLNAGSSSIKFALFESEAERLLALAVGQAEMAGAERRLVVRDGQGRQIREETWPGGDGFHTEALRRILAWRQGTFPGANVVAAGHRVVHGGVDYDAPVAVDDAVLDKLRTLIPLAPLHQPHNIAGILAAKEAWPH